MNPAIHVAGWTLLHFLWQGTLIALAAAVALRLLRGASPHARYVAACAALAAMFAAPLITARLISASGERPADARELERLAGMPLPAAGPAPAAVDVATAGRQRAAAVTIDAILPAVVIAWLTGVAVLLVRLAGGWWRVGRLHRAALRTTPSA